MEINQILTRNPEQLVIFKTCSICQKHYEFIDLYWDFKDDVECVYCAQGDPLPHNFENLEFITAEDLEIPLQIEECFKNIDQTIEKQMIEESVKEEVSSRKKKTNKKLPRNRKE